MMSSKSHHACDHEIVGRKSEKRKPLQPQPAVSLLANAEAESSGKAHMILQFLKPFGERGIVRVAREAALFDPRSVAREIAGRNGDLPQNIEAAVNQIERACAAKPGQYWLEVSNEGWRPDLSAFVYRGQIIGRRYSAGRRLRVQHLDMVRNYPLARKGQMKQWREIVRLARRSSRMRLAMCAAFAAPLLKVADLQSFMLVIFGSSKTGKTTCQLAAASVIGIGNEGALPNFNSTLPSLQEICSDFNDLVMPVNEIGLLSGTKRNAYSSLKPLIYRYSEGRDTSRHSKTQYPSGLGLATWHGIMIASSENSIEALAAIAGHSRDKGEYARAFDVPAVRPGHETVFDSYPHNISSSQRAVWAREQFFKIRQLCAENHGLAFTRYAKFLIKNKMSLKADIEQAMEQFLISLPQNQLSGALQHAARNFALLYAGAVLARQAGLLPWRLAATQKALHTCFKDGLREIERSEGAEARARKVVLQGIADLKPEASIIDPYEVDGWHYRDEKGRILFSVRTSCFHKWFRRREDERAALRWLYRSDLLALKDGAVPDFPNTDWAMTHRKVGAKNPRTFTFRDPR